MSSYVRSISMPKFKKITFAVLILSLFFLSAYLNNIMNQMKSLNGGEEKRIDMKEKHGDLVQSDPVKKDDQNVKNDVKEPNDSIKQEKSKTESDINSKLKENCRV
uniref:Uncharacterized protein n=1 Tax=Acrobeloides nanus TaxID=290746 RepID=A0A914DSP8_9BILA